MEHFVTKAGKSLRLGYTTGSCAALAARAATCMLLSGRVERESSLVTPKGIRVTVPLYGAKLGDAEATCAVRKDAGDDPDITDGILVYATVRRLADNTVDIDGGPGVGRVTKPGLDQPAGAAAINSVPRDMIEREVRAVCGEFGYGEGISVVVSIPGGEAIAAKTFNPELGVVGGLSVIGTSGMVEPMSTQAVVDTIRVEMNVIRSGDGDGVILVPGNYGEAFLRGRPDIARRPRVKCSNFIGESLDIAVALGFREVLIVGHMGKLVKLSGGVMDTHSRVADCRMELLALHAAIRGAGPETLRRVLAAVTVDDGMAALGDERDAVIDTVLERAESYCRRRVGGALATGLAAFSNRAGMLGISKGAAEMLARWENASG